MTNVGPPPSASDDETIEILLVDDRESNLTAMESVLASPDYHLVKLQSGAAVLRYLLEHEPALILLDVQMPEMDGFETARLLKQSPRTRDIPIIFITAIHHDERYELTGYSHGAVDYIQKPFDPLVLRSKVAVFADLVRKTRRLLQAERRLRQNEWKEREQRIVELELRNLRREQRDQRRYLDLVEGISHGIVWSADAETLEISFVSPSAERITGYPPDHWKMENRFFLNHTYEDDREKLLRCLESLQKKNFELAIEHRFVAKNGAISWFHSGFRLGRTENGNLEIRALSVDITKIKEAENILVQNKRRSDFLAEAGMLLSESLDYETTLNRLGTLAVPRLADWFAIHMQDEHGNLNLLSVNHSDSEKLPLGVDLLKKLQLENDRGLGLWNSFQNSRAELLSPVTSEFIQERVGDPKLQQVLKQLPVRSMMFVPLATRNRTLGVMTFVLSESTELYTPDDLSFAEELARRAALAIDNAHLYQVAQAAIHTRDEFLSVASHELKTPLTPLKLQTQILMRMLKTNQLEQLRTDQFQKVLQTSDRQLERLSRLVENLLDISRITGGQLSLNPEKFDYVHLWNDVIDRFARSIESAKTPVTLELPKSLMAQWDLCRAEQVVTNLLTNAIKYGQGHPIDVRVWLEGSSVCTSVRDHGIGIDKKDFHRIFDRFERAVPGSHFSGLGLGLYITRQIIAAHSGKIEVQSELGQGATFTFSLPQTIEAKDTEAPPVQPNQMGLPSTPNGTASRSASL